MSDLLAVISAEAQRKVGRLEADRLRERWFATEEGLLAFAWEAVKTKDEHDGRLKALPREFYLEDHLRNFLREPTYFICKSRQIMITWTTYVALVWEALRERYCAIALVPKKDEDGEVHIEDRIRNTIWPALPEWLRSDFDMAMSKGLFHLKTHRTAGRWDSWITSFARGKDQLRQYTHSIVFWDEMGYQDYARETWRAAIPTAGTRGDAGGRVICNSTLVPGSFYDYLMTGSSLNHLDSRLLDRAIAVANGDADPDGVEVTSPGIGIAHFRSVRYGAFCAVYSFLADSAKRLPSWEMQEAIRFGGKDSPDWQLDYRMRREALRGVRVFPSFDPRWNVVEEREIDRECELFLSFDFGHTNPTAVLFWEWNERTRTLTGFDEIYLSNTPVQVFKQMIAAKLAAHLGLVSSEEVIFSEVLGDSVGDPVGVAFMNEYLQEPNPLVVRGNPPPEKGSTPWKVNNVRVGEYRLDSGFRPSFICCGMRQFADPGDTMGRCTATALVEGKPIACGKEQRATPSILVMRGRMPNLLRELPMQVRVDPVDRSLETPEKSRKVADHATDSARYATMRYPEFLSLEAGPDPVPEIMRLPKSKLTTQQLFWRQFHEEAEKLAAQDEDPEVGEIEYDEDSDEVDPLYVY